MSPTPYISIVSQKSLKRNTSFTALTPSSMPRKPTVLNVAFERSGLSADIHRFGEKPDAAHKDELDFSWTTRPGETLIVYHPLTWEDCTGKGVPSHSMLPRLLAHLRNLQTCREKVAKKPELTARLRSIDMLTRAIDGQKPPKGKKDERRSGFGCVVL